MNQNTIDYPGFEATDQCPAPRAAKIRYDLIVRARQDIREGLYDDDARIQEMLAGCMDRIVADTQQA
ncbi:MAG: hypothetical protein AAF711_15830 [Planctomycetota bacterium]